MNKLLLTAALAGVFAAAAANAADPVKCYGAAKAGKNDCKSAAAGGHSCKGQATKDNDANDFALVADKAACDAAKGSMEAPKS